MEREYPASHHLSGAKLKSALSYSYLVDEMQSSEHWRRYHCAALATRRGQSRCAGGSLAYRPMRPPLVEMRDVLGQDLTQVTLIEDEGLIQALLSDRSHPSLSN
jgi:hypothetical protein